MGRTLARQGRFVIGLAGALATAACGADSDTNFSDAKGGAANTGGTAVGPSGGSSGTGGASSTGGAKASGGKANGGSDAATGGSDAATGGSDAAKGGSEGDPAGSGGTMEGEGGSVGGGGKGSGGGGGTPSEGGTESGGQTGGAGDAGAASGGAEPDPLEALDEAVSAFCEAARGCCEEHGVPATLDDCESMYAMYQPAVASIMNGTVTLDFAALATCQAAYAEGPDQCNLNAVVEACGDVFVGTQGVDEPCTDGFDCDRSSGAMTCLITDSSGAELSGVCKTVPHAQLDETCSTTCRLGANCSSTTIGSDAADPLCFEDEGLVCEYVGPDSVCHAIVPLNEPCDSFDECGSQAYCDETCQPKSALGQPCGNGCRPELQCSDQNTCDDPTWATASACMGYAPGP